MHDKNTIWAIAIILKDNDFSNTMRPLLLSICRVIEHWQGRDVAYNFRRIEDALRAGVLYHYLAFQNLACPTAQSPEDVEDYLLKKMRVYFNEEAADMLVKKDYDHGAWYVDVASQLIVSF